MTGCGVEPLPGSAAPPQAGRRLAAAWPGLSPGSPGRCIYEIRLGPASGLSPARLTRSRSGSRSLCVSRSRPRWRRAPLHFRSGALSCVGEPRGRAPAPQHSPGGASRPPSPASPPEEPGRARAARRGRRRRKGADPGDEAAAAETPPIPSARQPRGGVWLFPGGSPPESERSRNCLKSCDLSQRKADPMPGIKY